MLSTPKDYPYKVQEKFVPEDFKINYHDVVVIQVFSNDGFKAIDINGFMGGTGSSATQSFMVELDGTIKLPVLGRINIIGYTPREAEIMLEEKFSEFYIKPFVILRVTNRKVIVFTGANEGSARIVPLTNSTTTLIEVLAGVGGISQRGRAFNIKLIRKNGDKSDVYMIDFSTLEGYQKGNMVLLSDDIIYVETRPNVVRQISQELIPYLTLLNTIIISITIFRQIR